MDIDSFTQMTPAQRAFITPFLSKLASAIQLKTSELVSTKHLYQRLDCTDVVEALVSEQERAALAVRISRADLMLRAAERWQVQWRGPQLSHQRSSMAEQGVCLFGIETAKLYCRRCEAREAHNATWAHECDPQGGVELGDRIRRLQRFAFGFQCQSCKAEYPVLLIEREGLSLYVVGRTPIEEVEVPRQIPREESEYYRCAVIASSCNQVLAGIFYLRVTIEQHARRVTSYSGSNMEEMFDKYNKVLGTELVEMAPSLGSIYGTLSTAIHAADASSSVFEHALEGISSHFELVAAKHRAAKSRKSK